MGRDPANAFHRSGNAFRASEITRRKLRFASVIAFPRRCAARRNASSVAPGILAGSSSKNSPARDNTPASIGSDLFLPANAGRSRAECRLPTNANEQPASPSAIDNGSHVIDVGSATAITPRYAPNRFVNIARPDKVGGAVKSSMIVPASPATARRTTM